MLAKIQLLKYQLVTTHLSYDLPDHDDNLHGVQRNEPRHSSHDASIGVLWRPGEHVEDEGNKDGEEDNSPNSSERNPTSNIIRALGTDESEAWGIPLTAYGAIWPKPNTVVGTE